MFYCVKDNKNNANTHRLVVIENLIMIHKSNNIIIAVQRAYKWSIQLINIEY